MKSTFDITLTEIHVGRGRIVVTLGLGGDDPAQSFLLKLQRDDANRFDGIGLLILCTNGGTKNTPKRQQADIATAKQRKVAYFAAKAAPGSTLNYQETDS